MQNKILELSGVPYEVVITNKGKYGRKVNICGANFFLPSKESVKVLAESSADVLSLLDQATGNLKVEIGESVDTGDVVKYPKFTEPSFTVTLDKTSGTAGSSFTATGKMVFNRGTINPAYGTSGYRAGLPTSYEVGGQVKTTSDLEIPIEISIDSLAEGNTTYEFKVNYSAGEQPKDSEGNNYGSPCKAGSLTKSIIITGVAKEVDKNTFYIGSSTGENKPEVLKTNLSSITSTEIGTNINAVITLPNGSTVLQAVMPVGTSRTDYPYVLLVDSQEISEVYGYDSGLTQSWLTSNDTFTKGESVEIDGITYNKWICSAVNTSGQNSYRLVLA